MSSDFEKYLKKKGIKHETSVAHCSPLGIPLQQFQQLSADQHGSQMIET